MQFSLKERECLLIFLSKYYGQRVIGGLKEIIFGGFFIILLLSQRCAPIPLTPRGDLNDNYLKLDPGILNIAKSMKKEDAIQTLNYFFIENNRINKNSARYAEGPGAKDLQGKWFHSEYRYVTSIDSQYIKGACNMHKGVTETKSPTGDIIKNFYEEKSDFSLSFDNIIRINFMTYKNTSGRLSIVYINLMTNKDSGCLKGALTLQNDIQNFDEVRQILAAFLKLKPDLATTTGNNVGPK